MSSDRGKHGRRVLDNLHKLGYRGRVWGVNPKLPEVEGVTVYARIADLPGVPDVVVSAVPAHAVPALAREAGLAGVGTVIVFAGGFAETGAPGSSLQADLAAATVETGIRVLGPNSGGVIAPSDGVAMSFLTCLDRPAGEIRSGPVGLVTQSGGMGSYVHNLAAAASSGLAASISTGNEVDLGVADGIEALAAMEEVRAIAVILEAVRDGPAFVRAVERAHAVGKRVVVTRIGRSERGRHLMKTHTGALARPERVLDGVLRTLGATVAETPAEMFEIASILGHSSWPAGPRVGVVTHSGGVAILLTDLAAGTTIELPPLGEALRRALEPLLDQGAPSNPIDMGGIIGGPQRFAQVVEAVARSGDVEMVLAVSSAHPPAHSTLRADALIALRAPVPVVHLWMAGDLGRPGLEALRAAGLPVTEEPRAAIRAVAALGSTRDHATSFPAVVPQDPPSFDMTEFRAKQVVRAWGLPVAEGRLAADREQAVRVAATIGYPVAVKVSSPDLAHKTEVGGVVLGVTCPESVRAAFDAVTAGVPSGCRVEGVLVEEQVAGPEVIVGSLRDDQFGPMVMVGIGGVVAEALDDVAVAPAPVSTSAARRLIRSLAGLRVLTHPRTGQPADLDALAEIVAVLSRHVAANPWVMAVDLNPVVWSGVGWLTVDATIDLVRP